MHQDKRDGAPTCLSVAPCSVPSSLAWKRRARGEVNATARLDGPCARRLRSTAGRDGGTASWHEQRNCTDKEQVMMKQHILFPAEVCERMRRDGGTVFPAHAKTGDPNGPLEACPLMRTHAR